MRRSPLKKNRQSKNHAPKRKVAMLRRNARAHQRAIRRKNQIDFFKANPSKGSPSQVAYRIRKLRRKLRKIEKGTFTAKDVTN